MRTGFLTVIFLILSSACSSPFNHVHPGMTKTDVLIELGAPSDAYQANDKDYLVYPSSERATCRIEFVDDRVTERKMVCDDSEQYRGLASADRKPFEERQTPQEHAERVERYCGLKPQPHPRCRITNQCVNGAWEEICN